MVFVLATSAELIFLEKMLFFGKFIYIVQKKKRKMLQ